MPNIETVVYAVERYDPMLNGIGQLDGITFDLTALQKLQSFRMKINSAVKYFDYLFIHFHFKKHCGDEEAFYSVQEKNHPCEMTDVTQEFIVECSQNKALSTKHLTFVCNNKLEGFSLAVKCWRYEAARRDKYHEFNMRFINEPTLQ